MMLDRLNRSKWCVNSRDSILEWAALGINHGCSGSESFDAIHLQMAKVVAVLALELLNTVQGSILRFVS